jgi:hypothetical protein
MVAFTACALLMSVGGGLTKDMIRVLRHGRGCLLFLPCVYEIVAGRQLPGRRTAQVGKGLSVDVGNHRRREVAEQGEFVGSQTSGRFENSL